MFYIHLLSLAIAHITSISIVGYKLIFCRSKTVCFSKMDKKRKIGREASLNFGSQMVVSLHKAFG
jgi:hypothetical protein